MLLKFIIEAKILRKEHFKEHPYVFLTETILHINSGKCQLVYPIFDSSIRDSKLIEDIEELYVVFLFFCSSKPYY